MQLAINALILVVAFAVAAKQKQFQKAIYQCMKKLRLVTNSFNFGTPASERKQATLLPNDVDETWPVLHAELLTRFVTS